MKNQSLVALFFTFLIVACGGSGGGGGSALNTPDKSKAVTHGIATVQSVLGSKMKSGGSAANFFMPTFASVSPGTPSPYNLEKSRETFQRKIQSADCQWIIPPVSGNSPGSGTDGGFKLEPIRIELKGARCPMNALFELKGQQTGNDFSGEYTMSFQIFDEGLRQESQLQNLIMKGSLSGRISQGANKISTLIFGSASGSGVLVGGEGFQSSMKMDFNMEMGTSERRGPSLRPHVMFDDFKMSGSFEQSYSFQDGKTELKSKFASLPNGQFEELYFVNGRSVSKVEFEKYSSLINFPGFETGGPGAPPGGGSINPTPFPRVPMQCELKLFDRNLVTAEQLYSDPKNPSLFPFVSLSTCGLDNATTGILNGKSYRINLRFTENFVLGESMSFDGSLETRVIPVPETMNLLWYTGEAIALFTCESVRQEQCL